MLNNLFTQFILVPTRKNNIFDLFMTSNDRLISNVSASPKYLPDHNLVDLLLSYNPLSLEQHQSHTASFEPDSFQSLDFQKEDFEKIKEKLNSVNWDELKDKFSFEEFPVESSLL